MRKRIRLTEADLHRIVKESIINTLEKDLDGNAIYDLGNGYTTSDLYGLEKSLEEKLSYWYDKKSRYESEIEKIESIIQDFEEQLDEVKEVLYGSEQ